MSHSDPSIARTTVRGSAYSIAASALTIALGALRTYLMVVFLLPDEIGLAALALFYVELVKQLGNFGLQTAFVQMKDAGAAGRNTYFTFNFILGAASMFLAAAAAPAIAAFYPRYNGLAILIQAYALLTILQVLNQPQVTILEKELSFGRIAVLDIAGATAKSLVGPGMAFLGFGVWAIIGDYAAGICARFGLLYFWLRAYRPRLAFDRSIAGRLWTYGKSVWAGTNLTFLIDNFDDFWVGTALGKAPLGLYSKAYEFSRYPRRVIANPVLSVFFPAFAQLQDDRPRLSRAFFRATSLMVRTGALFSLVVILTAPEAFTLLLPEAWLPMRLTFQLMIVYTFLDPLSLAALRLLFATGRPQEVARIRWIQLAVFIPTVIAGAAWLGIEGVALAAGFMVLTGTVLLFRRTTAVVDYSPRSLWFWPAAALIGIAAAAAGLQPALAGYAVLPVFIGKLVGIPTMYGLILWLGEREQLLTGLRMVRSMLAPSPQAAGNAEGQPGDHPEET